MNSYTFYSTEDFHCETSAQRNLMNDDDKILFTSKMSFYSFFYIYTAFLKNFKG